MVVSKTKVIQTVTRQTGLHKDTCEMAINVFLEVIKDYLEEGKSVNLPEFCKFMIVDQPESRRRNPTTGKVQSYPATKKIKCVLSESVKKLAKG